MMSRFDPAEYGAVFETLLAGDRRRALDAGSPERQMRAELAELSVDSAFTNVKVVDREMAECCLSGVWLLHDFLDESHTISQGIDTTSGSFWHAIMHRREGDFSNAKYWFRRVGRHPVLEELGAGFDPFEFVDRCEAAVRGRSKEREACQDLQQREWELLFDFCYRGAIGGAPGR
jgi:hypothetical protein